MEYNRYQFTKWDMAAYIGTILIKSGLISFLFYDTYKAVILLIPVFVMDYKNMKKNKIVKRKRLLTMQFKDMMEAIVNSLNAGYSLEHGFCDAKKDLSLIYDKDAYIFKEIDIILTGLKMNIPIEKLLKDLGRRSDIEDIDNFAKVVAVAKKRGGNLIKIIQKTVRNISDKITVEEEIETMITSKKLESKIMMLMPYGILFYLKITNAEFMKPLYHNCFGIILMTVFILLMQFANWWANKIMEIYV